MRKKYKNDFEEKRTCMRREVLWNHKRTLSIEELFKIVYVSAL